MKKSKFTEAQIVFALRQAETGTSVEEVCRKLGISHATFFNWKKKRQQPKRKQNGKRRDFKYVERLLP